MNNVRRKEIDSIIYAIENIKSRVEDVLSEEEFSFDNMPEGLKYSDRGQQSEEAIENLQEAVDNISDLIDYLNDSKGV